jgi:uncharacterized protein
MLQGLQGLVELSRIDVQIAELDVQKAALPATREALLQERARTAAAVEAAEAALGEAEREQRRQEVVVADREAQVAKLEGQQHQIKTNVAYTALLHEIEQARGAISEAETRVLEAMEVIESTRAELERARALAKATEARVAEQGRALDEREKSLDQTLDALRRERTGLADGLDAALLERYAKIASRRRPAVAAAQRGTCMGCRVDLPPQLLLELRRGERLQTCGNCHRILVLEVA